MIYGYDIKKLLENNFSKNGFERFFYNTYDKNVIKSISVYDNGSKKERMTDSESTKTYKSSFSIFIRYNKNSVESLNQSVNVYNFLKNYNGLLESSKDSHTINFIDMEHDIPLDLGMDKNGVFERNININVYYTNNTL